VPALAVSQFLHSVFVVLVVAPVILLWCAAIVDILRRHRSGWSVVGWFLVVFALPIFGTLIYFAARKPDEVDAGGAEAEAAYRAQADLARQAAARPDGSVTGVGNIR